MNRLAATIFATSLLAGFSFAQKIRVELDWRATYRLNAVLDGISTYQFRQRGYIELNPISAPFVNRNRWAEASLILVGEMALVDWAESRLKGRWRGLIYVLGSLAHGCCTWHNRKLGGTMIPIPIFRVRF